MLSYQYFLIESEKEMKMKLLIAIPTTDFMHADFVNSLIKLTAHLQREGIAHHVELVAGTLVYLARNKLACKAINEGLSKRLEQHMKLMEK